MSSSLVHQAFAVALAAAREAGERIVQIRDSGDLRVSFKGEIDLVTHADVEAEGIIIRHIRDAFPAHEILSEEGYSSLQGRTFKGPLWIIDPIDGTTNYAHGHQYVGVSIAFAVDGVVECAVVHAPFLSETFSAIRGEGARLNGKPIAPRDCRQLRHALVATGFPYQRDELELIVKSAVAVLSKCRDLRRIGACSLDVSWVAMGRLDGFYESVKPWDIAAAGLIAREAGARYGNLKEIPQGGIPPDLYSSDVLVTAPAIYEALRALIRGEN